MCAIPVADPCEMTQTGLDDFNPWKIECWGQLAGLIQSGAMTLSAASKAVGLSPAGIRKRLKSYGIWVPLEPGRPRSEMPYGDVLVSLKELRLGKHIMCGYKHAAESITGPDQYPPYNTTYEICQNEGWLGAPRKKKVLPEHRHRFEAKWVDYLWHTDLHEIASGTSEKGPWHLYMIVFLDDLSRRVMHWELISDKTMATTTKALEKVIAASGCPAVLTTDNGGEFIGHDFKEVIIANSIRPWRTKPYTPQQNGKVERFWRTLDKARGGEYYPEKIRMIVELYNAKWKCQPIATNPDAFRESQPHWSHCLSELRSEISQNLIWDQDLAETLHARRLGNSRRVESLRKGTVVRRFTISETIFFEL